MDDDQKNDPKPQPSVDPLKQPQTIVVLDLGTMRIFTRQTLEEMMRDAPPTSWYWRDAASPQGEGPFMSLLECMKNYCYITKLARTSGTESVPQTSGKVIRVDFANKRRVDN